MFTAFLANWPRKALKIWQTFYTDQIGPSCRSNCKSIMSLWLGICNGRCIIMETEWSIWIWTHLAEWVNAKLTIYNSNFSLYLQLMRNVVRYYMIFKTITMEYWTICEEWSKYHFHWINYTKVVCLNIFSWYTFIDCIVVICTTYSITEIRSNLFLKNIENNFNCLK